MTDISLFKRLAVVLLLIGASGCYTPLWGQDSFAPGKEWLDTEGKSIQAHGGGILKVGSVYYWYGENHEKGSGNKTGISCYSSGDLYHWKNEGVVLPKEEVPPAFRDTGVCERPKVIYNKKTKKYVMWMHLDSRHYYAAEAGVATADKPLGPFHFIREFRPVAYDYNSGKYSRDEPHLHEQQEGNTFRDMNLFKDGNGKAYVIYASESNATLYIVALDDSYTGVRQPSILGKTWTRIYVKKYREAPAMFKYKGHYFLITSAQSGWRPNAANYAVASSVLGPWEVKGNPCVGEDSATTFHSQSTFVLPAPDGVPSHFIFQSDRWNPRQLGKSTYIWLPFCVKPDLSIQISYRGQWDLAQFKLMNCNK